MHKKGKRTDLFGGKKINKSHSTLIQAAAKFIRKAKTIKEIKKIIVSKVVDLGTGMQRIKIFRIPAGLRVMIRGPAEQQDFYFYTCFPDIVKEKLLEIWNEQLT